MPIALPPSAQAAREPFGGETGALIRAFDWTAVGMPGLHAWPQSLRTLVDTMVSSPTAMVLLWGGDGVLIYNDAYAHFAGARHPGVFGMPALEAWPEAAEFNSHVMAEGLAGRTLSFANQELILSRHGAPESVWLNLDYSPVFDEVAEPAGVLAIVVDVTESQRALVALRESEARFRLTADSAPAPMWVTGPERRREFVNRAYADFAGMPYEQALTLDWLDILHPDDAGRVAAEAQAGEASLQPFSLEGRFRRGDGEWRWLRSTSQPRYGPTGEAAGFVGVAFDITAERAAAEHQRLLINELNHRVKNTLATVQSLAAQSLKAGTDAEEALRGFQGRLLALSRAHDILTRESWESARVGEVVDQALRAWCGQVSCDGPTIEVEPRVALALSMTLHELATNAAKYGGLSRPDGGVDVCWADGDSHLRLTWTEHGGPPVAQPDRRGFGVRLIERQLSHELGGAAAFDFRSEGLVVQLDAPLPDAAAEYTDPTRAPSAASAAPA